MPREKIEALRHLFSLIDNFYVDLWLPISFKTWRNLNADTQEPHVSL